MYSNLEKLTAVLVHWAKPMIDTLVAERLGRFQPVQAANEWVKKYFPVSGNYSIVNDLSFLAVPATEIVMEPIIRNAVGKLNLSDAEIPEYASKLVGSMIDEAEKNGKVTVFNLLEFEKSDFESLRSLLEKNLPVGKVSKYQVKE